MCHALVWQVTHLVVGREPGVLSFPTPTFFCLSPSFIELHAGPEIDDVLSLILVHSHPIQSHGGSSVGSIPLFCYCFTSVSPQLSEVTGNLQFIRACLQDCCFSGPVLIYLKPCYSKCGPQGLVAFKMQNLLGI